jgi:tetratricopeptide (TPR) repeat protein
MAKICSVCKTSYPDNLNQCPHCKATGTVPPQSAAVDLDKSSSGEIFLDAPEADLAALGTPAARGPEASDEIVEIDWSAIEADSTESSSVVDLAKDAYVELEAPSSETNHPKPRADHPSSAEIVLPPEAGAGRAGAPSVPMVTPVHPTGQTPPLATKAEGPSAAQPAAAAGAAGRTGDDLEAPSSFTMEKPAKAEEPPTVSPAGSVGTWNEAELIDIEHLTAGDESSEVDLGSGPHRRKGRHTDPAQRAADSSSGYLVEAGREQDLVPWSEESSAVDLGSTAEVSLPASQTSGIDIHREFEEPTAIGAEHEAHREEAAADLDEADLGVAEDEAQTEEEPEPVARAERSRGGMSGLVGGVVGAVLATAACAGVWFSGLLPESGRRGTSGTPAASVQPAPRGDGAAVAAREDPRTLMEHGDYAKVLVTVQGAEGQEPSPGGDLLALRGEAQWRSYLVRQRQEGQAPQAGDKPVEEAKATLVKSQTPEGTFWLGQIQESLGDLAGARKIYEDGLKQYQDKPALARMFQTALRRVESLEEVPEREAADEKKPEIRGLRQGALHRGGAGGPEPGLVLVALLGQAPAGEKAAAGADEMEAGDYFWEALQLARKNQYAEAIATLDRAATAHKQRRVVRQNKSQNPKSDPGEQIFLKCCQELEAYWKLRMRLADGGYLDTAKQRSALKAVDTLIKDAKAPKADPAVQVVIDKLKKDKDVSTQDPEVKDLAKGLDVVLEAKKKAEDQLAAVKSALAEAKVVSDKQPDPVKGVGQLLHEKKQAAESLKEAQDSLAALKTTGNEALTATVKVLQAEKYVTGDQPSIPKGVERLVADKKAAEAKLKDASALVKAAEDKAKVAEDKAKTLDAQVKTADAKIKDLTTQARTAEDKAKDASALARSADAKVKDLADQAKAAEEKARDLGTRLKSADGKLAEATTRLKTADETLQAIAARLAMTRAVSPDARGADLIRGAEQVARLAVQQPRTTTNPPAVRPRENEPVQPAVPVEFHHDPLLAEQYYNRGLNSYWSRRYGAAEGDFQEAIRLAGPTAEDARLFYFLGLSQLGLGKEDKARVAFREAGNLERDHRPASGAVNASLERVQGPVRRYVDAFRR